VIIEKNTLPRGFSHSTPMTEVAVIPENTSEFLKVAKFSLSPRYERLSSTMEELGGFSQLCYFGEHDEASGITFVVQENGEGDITVSNGVRTILRQIFGMPD
jgi:hypothetical protein